MEYLLPEETEPREFLTAHLDVRRGPVTSGAVTFYDTFDGRLRGAGVTLRHAGGRLMLTDRETGEEVAAADGARAQRLFDRDLPEALRERLAGIIEMRALAHRARVRTRRELFAVINEDGKTVARLTVENRRLRATAVRGYDGELEKVLATLALNRATVPLVDEAIAAAGEDPAGVSSKVNVKLDPDEPANEAARKIFTRLVEVIRLNLPGTLEDVDSEFLHDLRVAVRRSRSLQRQFAGIYPDRLQQHRDEFKRLQAVTGDLRDLDVYLLDFDDLQASLPERMRDDLEPLRPILTAQRAKAFSATRRALRAQRTEETLTSWLEFVADAPTAERTVHDLASHRITRVYRKMVKQGKAIDDDSPAEDLHELRKVGKELRYLLEFFSSLYPPEVTKPFIKTLKGLQDQLGRFQDHEVQANSLRELAPGVEDHLTLMAMGALVQRFIEDEIAARAEFAERFETFASTEQRAIVKEHFG
jgi:CHAD domain-containing protein